MPERVPAGNPVPVSEVRAMFDRIAPIYDALNMAMTAGLDARWRRSAVGAAALRPGMAAVDVACGTGALTRELAGAVGPGGSVIGIDISPAMLARGRRRATPGIRYELAGALELPLDDGSVDAATIGFGLRNMPDYARCLQEMARVTRPGGRIVVLEIASPAGGAGRLIAAVWFERVVPLLGRAAGGGSAYRYLPESVRGYPSPSEVADLMRRGGMREVGWRRLWPGLVTLHVGRRT